MLSRQRTVDELKALAKELGEPPRSKHVREHSSVLYRSLLMHFGSLDAARKAAGVPGLDLRKIWSEEKVIAELLRLYRQGVRPCVYDLVKAGHHDLTSAIAGYVGGIRRARRLAGVPDPPRAQTEREPWDEDRVISEILALHKRGKCLAASKVPPKLYSAAWYYLDGWRNAVEAAGFDYDKVRLVREPYTREELVVEIRQVAKRQPNITLAELHRHRAVEAWLRIFGSIENAARQAGLKDWPRRRGFPVLSRAKTVAGIRARKRQKQSLVYARLEGADDRLLRSAERRFGTWRAAVEAAGFEYTPARREPWTRKEIMAALRARRDAGKPMNAAALRVDDVGLYQAAKKYLGGFSKSPAARRAGASASIAKKWTKKRIVKDLRDIHAAGNPVRGPFVDHNLAGACRKAFGSMHAAREAAGVPQTQERWDKAKVLAELKVLPHDQRPRRPLVSAAQKYFGSWRAAIAQAGRPPKKRTLWTREAVRTALRRRNERGEPMTASAVRRDDPSLYDAVANHLGKPFSKIVGELPKNTRRR